MHRRRGSDRYRRWSGLWAESFPSAALDLRDAVQTVLNHHPPLAFRIHDNGQTVLRIISIRNRAAFGVGSGLQEWGRTPFFVENEHGTEGCVPRHFNSLIWSDLGINKRKVQLRLSSFVHAECHTGNQRRIGQVIDGRDWQTQPTRELHGRCCKNSFPIMDMTQGPIHGRVADCNGSKRHFHQKTVGGTEPCVPRRDNSLIERGLENAKT